MSINESLFNTERLISRLILSETHLLKMRSEAESLAPEEACGILVGVYQGDTSVSYHIIPITNSLHSRTRFYMAPEELISQFIEMDKNDLQLVGIYHSHPMGPAEPSGTDIAEAYYPEAVHLIWSRIEGEWAYKCFSIQNGVVKQVKVDVVD